MGGVGGGGEVRSGRVSRGCWGRKSGVCGGAAMAAIQGLGRR